MISPRLAGLRMLVVEDDPDQLVEMLRALESLGCVLIATTSAEDALAIARAERFDMILTDNVLSSMSGLRSLAEYAKIGAPPVAIMTTGYDEEFARDARLLGATLVLPKPLNEERLVRELAPFASDRPRR